MLCDEVRCVFSALAARARMLLALGIMVLPAHALDLHSAQDAAESMVKLRCSLDTGKDVVSWWKGTLFGQEPGKAPAALMGFEGYNICRAEYLDDGTWRMRTRELVFYRDLDSGEILDVWDNPMTGARNTVLAIANDPVNQVFNPPGRPARALPWVEMGDQLMLTLNIPLSYPNPLSPEQFPRESSGTMYVGSEHFMFFVSRQQMENQAIASAPVTYSWTRTGPWLPWMEVGQRPGGLLYIAQGGKLNALDELPKDILERVRSDYPEYASAPSTWVTPNVTSWTYYRDLKQSPATTP